MMLPYHLRHKAGGPFSGSRKAGGLVLRGVVLKVHRPGDPQAASRLGPDLASGATGVTCDILVYEKRYRTILYGIPIRVQSAGLNDHEVWVPRESTIDLEVGALNVSPEQQISGPVSKAHDMDGDHVLIGFLGDDLNQPIVIGQIPHPRNNRRPNHDDATLYKYERWIRGTQYAVQDDGNVVVDMTNASTGEVLPDGSEVPAGTNASGNMTITVLGGDRTTGAKVRVIDSVSSAPEPVVLGDSWIGDTDTHLGDLDGFLTRLSASLTEISAALGGFGIPTPNTGLAVAEIAAFQVGIAAYRASIATSQSLGAPYLSSHLEVD